MSDLRVGVNLPTKSTDPRQMDDWLRAFAADGFDCVEISLDTFPLIIGGEVRRERPQGIVQVPRIHAAVGQVDAHPEVAHARPAFPPFTSSIMRAAALIAARGSPVGTISMPTHPS